jgi:hypothetical protein
VALDFVPIILLFILLSAFTKIREINSSGDNKVGLSNKQVAYMLAANSAYAVLDPISWLIKANANNFGIYTFFLIISYWANLLGLIVLTHNLCQICDI